MAAAHQEHAPFPQMFQEVQGQLGVQHDQIGRGELTGDRGPGQVNHPVPDPGQSGQGVPVPQVDAVGLHPFRKRKGGGLLETGHVMAMVEQ